VIVVVAALKGGVGKTSSAVYLSAAVGGRRAVRLVDADPQASAAEWLETADDPALEGVELIEAPTERLLTRALAKVEPDDVAVVDTPPGDERLLLAALDAAHVAVVPTRVGGVETPQALAVLRLIPHRVPAGLVISSARTYTHDYQDAMAEWRANSVPVWGSIPERVSIAAGPSGRLSPDGLEAYHSVWRRVQRAARPG
jgi:chromosome partitioning protein